MWSTTAGLTITVLIGTGLAIAGSLRGPSLLPWGGAFLETVTFAVVAALTGVAAAARDSGASQRPVTEASAPSSATRITR